MVKFGGRRGVRVANFKIFRDNNRSESDLLMEKGKYDYHRNKDSLKKTNISVEEEPMESRNVGFTESVMTLTTVATEGLYPREAPDTLKLHPSPNRE